MNSEQTDDTDADMGWAPPAARDLADWRLRIRDHMVSAAGRQVLAETALTIRSTLLPAVASAQAAAEILARQETGRLGDATLYYATAPMTHWARTAAATPPAEPVHLRRLPATSGLMLFAAPIGAYQLAHRRPARRPRRHTHPPHPRRADRADRRRLLVPVERRRRSPRRTPLAPPPRRRPPLSHPRPHPRNLAHLLQPGRRRLGTATPATPISTLPAGTITAGSLTDAARALAPLTWDTETLLTLDTALPAAHPDADPAQTWTHVVYTAWQMISQTAGASRLTEVDTLPRDRAGRRRDTRHHIHATSDVRVVRVHPDHHDSPTAVRGAERAGLDYRLRVAPYRRNTCLNPHAHAAGQCTHHEQIVAGYTRGPDHAPWRSRHTVHLWDQ